MKTFEQDCLALAENIAKSAGEIILKYFDGDQQVEFKPDKSFVTIADKTINNLVIEEIKAEYSEHGVIGEEASTKTIDQEYVWLCDPLDGTKAFVWGLPTSTFSLALTRSGRPLVGVVYDPFKDKLYTAIDGEGAYSNGETIRVSSASLDNGIMAATGDTLKFQTDPVVQQLTKRGMHMASFSGAVYKCMLVATGRMVGYVESGLGRYDVAAADIIIHEAGGELTNMGGQLIDYRRESFGAVVSNGLVHDELLEMAQKK